VTASTFLRDLAASRVLDVAGEAHKAATARGLVVTQTILTAAASPGHPVGVVVQVQAFRGDRTPYVALFDTASALGGHVREDRCWVGREAASVDLGDVFVWVVGDPVIVDGRP